MAMITAISKNQITNKKKLTQKTMAKQWMSPHIFMIPKHMVAQNFRPCAEMPRNSVSVCPVVRHKQSEKEEELDPRS
jgi:hypothetical protein